MEGRRGRVKGEQCSGVEVVCGEYGEGEGRTGYSLQHTELVYAGTDGSEAVSPPQFVPTFFTLYVNLSGNASATCELSLSWPVYQVTRLEWLPLPCIALVPPYLLSCLGNSVGRASVS